MGMTINGIIHWLDRTKERITELEEEKSVALFPTEIQKGKRGDVGVAGVRRKRMRNQRATVKMS